MEERKTENSELNESPEEDEQQLMLDLMDEVEDSLETGEVEALMVVLRVNDESFLRHIGYTPSQLMDIANSLTRYAIQQGFQVDPEELQ